MGGCFSDLKGGKAAMGGGEVHNLRLQRGTSTSNVATTASSSYGAVQNDAVDYFSRIELNLSASKLRDYDIMSKSDPMVVVYAQNKDGTLEELGRTEVVLNNLNPTWIQKIDVVFHFEIVQPLIFQVYDVDTKYHNLPTKMLELKDQDFLGEASCVLSEIVTLRSRSITLKLRNRNGHSDGNLGSITVHAEETIASKTALEMRLRCSNLDNKDWFSKSDPFLRISRIVETGGSVPVCKTEVVNDNLDPVWKPLCLSKQQYGSKENPLAIECFDFNSSGNHILNGELQTSIGILEKRYQEKAASNGDPQKPDSLHYIDPSGHFNAYQQAIMEVGEVTQFYDSDKRFPAWGFGGKTYNGPVSHCFNLNGNVGSFEILDGDNGQRLESSTGRIATRDNVRFISMRDVLCGEISRVQGLLEGLPGQFLTYVRSRDMKPLPNNDPYLSISRIRQIRNPLCTSLQENPLVTIDPIRGRVIHCCSTAMNKNVEDLDFGRDASRLDYFLVNALNVHGDDNLRGIAGYGGGGSTQQAACGTSANNGGDGGGGISANNGGGISANNGGDGGGGISANNGGGISANNGGDGGGGISANNGGDGGGGISANNGGGISANNGGISANNGGDGGGGISANNGGGISANNGGDGGGGISANNGGGDDAEGGVKALRWWKKCLQRLACMAC